MTMEGVAIVKSAMQSVFYNARFSNVDDDDGDGDGDDDDGDDNDDDNDDDIGQRSPVTSLRAQPPISFGPDTSAKLTHNTNIKELG